MINTKQKMKIYSKIFLILLIISSFFLLVVSSSNPARAIVNNNDVNHEKNNDIDGNGVDDLEDDNEDNEFDNGSQGEDNSSSGLQSIEYVPEDVKIDSLNIEFNPSICEFKIKITTNIPVSPNSFMISSELFDKEEWRQIQKDNALYGISRWTGSMAVGWEDRKSREFVLGVSREASLEKKDAVGKIILIGLYTTKKLKLTNPILLFYKGHYKKLPVLPLEKVFSGDDYLEKSGICRIEDPGFLCRIIGLFSKNQPLRFDNPFAQKYPLLYGMAIVVLFYLVFILGGFLILSYLFTLIFQRRPWGVVFDSMTLKPVEGAIVRIFDQERDKLLETKVTDKRGRFSFLPGKGDYYIKVVKPGYTFPSRILTSLHHPIYYHLYHGQNVRMGSDTAMFVTNIPLDPLKKPAVISRPSLIRRMFFALARAREALVIAFVIIIGLNLLLDELLDSGFSYVQWFSLSFIPLFLLELYFWHQGRRVRIMKKE